jgi:hypothetical protein
MSLFKKLVVPALVLASSFHMHAQIKNAKTITAKVSGNCGMCETTIEKAGNVKKEAQVEWDKNKQVATITYDSQKTDPDQVLRRIALAGYDNEKYLAPEETYNNLHGCCQYERTIVASDEAAAKSHNGHSADASANSSNNNTDKTAATNVFTPVFANYFSLHEALVKSDAKQAASTAGELQKAIGNISMAALTGEVHTMWMAASEKISSDARGIAASQDLKKQRALFASLSDSMHSLAKVAGLPQTVYYNNCPMFNDGKGANWLSDEKGIRNPYYGSQMLTCGKTIETIE